MWQDNHEFFGHQVNTTKAPNISLVYSGNQVNTPRHYILVLYSVNLWFYIK